MRIFRRACSGSLARSRSSYFAPCLRRTPSAINWSKSIGEAAILRSSRSFLLLHAVTPCTPFAGQNKCNSSIAADTVYVAHREIVCSVDRVSLDATSRRPIASASIGVSSNRLEGNALATILAAIEKLDGGIVQGPPF